MNRRTGAALPAGVAAATLGLCCVYLLPLGSTRLQAVSCWLAVAICASGMTYYSFKATRLLERAAPERRFWLVFTAAGVIFSAGEWIQLVTTIAEPASTAAMTGTGLARTIALGCGGIALIGMLATYPLPHRSARDRLCYHLDLATIITAVGAYGLYWTATAGWEGDGIPAREVLVVAAGPVLAMLLAFSVGRIYLSAAAPFRWHIGVLGPIAAGTEGLARALGPELARAGRPGPIFAMSLCCHALLFLAAWLQYHRHLSGRVVTRAARRHPYSLLPYGALAATYGLLLTTLVASGLDLRAWIILMGAVASTGIVVARQLVAFIDNAQLLSERDALAERLHAMAFTDSLTGLANRALFLERLDAALQRAGRAREPIGVLLIDLDDFKPVNDRYGHAAGDAVLVETARRLRESVRPDDLVARLGGDEFAVLIEHHPDFPEVAERIVQALNAPCRLPGNQQATVRASVGLAVPGSEVFGASFVLNLADQAMYRAKSSGKGSFRIAA